MTQRSSIDIHRETPHDARRAADKAGRVARKAGTNPASVALMRFGYGAKGVVYLILGGLAAKAAIGAGGATTDPKGALHALDIGTAGKLLLGLVAVGLFGYAFWNVVRAILDLDHRGKEAKGIITRIAFGVVALMYTLLGLTALQLATGTGNGGKSTDATTQDWTARFLNTPFGTPLVILAGVVVLAIAGALAIEAYRAHFQQYLKSGDLPETVRHLMVIAGRLGYGALSVVFAIIGIFLIVSASQHNAGQAKGLGGALQQLAQEPFGPFLLGIVALGLIAYGAFSLAEARYRRLGSS